MARTEEEKKSALEWAKRQQQYGQTAEHETRLRAGEQSAILRRKLEAEERSLAETKLNIERREDPRFWERKREVEKKTRAERSLNYAVQEAGKLVGTRYGRSGGSGKGTRRINRAYQQALKDFNTREKLSGYFSEYRGPEISGRDAVKKGLITKHEKGAGYAAVSEFSGAEARLEKQQLAGQKRIEDIQSQMLEQTRLASRVGERKGPVAALEEEFRTRQTRADKKFELSRKLTDEFMTQAMGTRKRSVEKGLGTFSSQAERLLNRKKWNRIYAKRARAGVLRRHMESRPFRRRVQGIAAGGLGRIGAARKAEGFGTVRMGRIAGLANLNRNLGARKI